LKIQIGKVFFLFGLQEIVQKKKGEEREMADQKVGRAKKLPQRSFPENPWCD
jgi:hypothetical protein